MSLFGSLMGDVEDDPFFGSQMRHMRQMNSMMNSLFSDPFGMLGVDQGALSIMGPRPGNAMMHFMPQMPSINRLFAGNMDAGHMSGSSFSSSTVVMSSGPGSKPQVYSSTSSTKVGPNGVKETLNTVQDSRSGTKKMAIGHHIGERGHVIARERNYYTGDTEEHQEFINLEEEEAEDFNREFQYKAGSGRVHSRQAIQAAPGRNSATLTPVAPQRLALPAPPVTTATLNIPNTYSEAPSRRHTSHSSQSPSSLRPSARRPLRTSASPLTTTSSPSVREVYSGSQPQRHRHRHHKHRHAPANSSNYNNTN